MALTTVELTPRIGTEIQTDSETLVSGKHAAQLRELLEQRKNWPDFQAGVEHNFRQEEDLCR